MKTHALPRRLPLVAATVLAIALLHRAESRLLARPADAAELLDLVSRGEGQPGLSRAVLVLQIVDCAESRAELARWSRAMAARALDPLAGSSGPVVMGVLVGPVPDDPAETRRILDQAGLDFPVRRDSSGRVAGFVRGLGYRETPVALLLDARGRLQRAGAPGSFPSAGGTPHAASMPNADPTTEDPS